MTCHTVYIDFPIYIYTIIIFDKVHEWCSIIICMYEYAYMYMYMYLPLGIMYMYMYMYI